MLPGRGDNSPLPEVAPDRSTAQSQDLKDRYIAYLEQSLERANEENRQLRELVSRLLQGAKVPVADLPPADNSVTLPPMFVASLRQDECRSREIIRLVKNVIVPTIACRDRKLYRWCKITTISDSLQARRGAWNGKGTMGKTMGRSLGRTMGKTVCFQPRRMIVVSASSTLRHDSLSLSPASRVV